MRRPLLRWRRRRRRCRRVLCAVAEMFAQEPDFTPRLPTLYWWASDDQHLIAALETAAENMEQFRLYLRDVKPRDDEHSLLLSVVIPAADTLRVSLERQAEEAREGLAG